MPRTKYEADSGDIHPITLSASRTTAAGAPPAGAISNDIVAKVSKGNREAGLRPRGVILYRTIGTAPNTFNRTSFLPVLTPAAYSGAGFNPEAEVTIGTVTWKVLRRRPEDV